MPLFEVDPNRAVLVQQPQDGTNLATTAQRVVDGQIDSLLGEQIFPVSERRTEHEPYMLAIDAAGSPVVIEVVSSLDERVLTRAMRFAGAAGRLTRAQLAARYSGGADAFDRDLARFRADLPFGAVADPTPGAGARLVVICSAAQEDVLDAVDFLRKPGTRASVLRASVVTAEDGRRFVDVSPLVTEHLRSAAPVQRTIEDPEISAPTLPPVVAPVTTTPESRPAAQPATTSAPKTPSSPVESPARAATPEATTLTPPASAPSSARPSASRPLTRAERRALAAAQAEPAAMSAPEASQPEAPERTEVPSVVTRRAPDTRPSRRSQRTQREASSELPSEPTPQLRDDYVPYEPPSDYGQSNYSSSGYDFYRADALADPLTAPRTEPERRLHDSQPLSPPMPSPAPLPELSAEDDIDEVDPDLIALGQNIGFSAALVWTRPRRGQRFEAVLHTDGQIELTDGSTYRNPDAAAAAASGSSTADGWSVWRFGDGGPSLMDEFRARFS